MWIESFVIIHSTQSSHEYSNAAPAVLPQTLYRTCRNLYHSSFIDRLREGATSRRNRANRRLGCRLVLRSCRRDKTLLYYISSLLEKVPFVNVIPYRSYAEEGHGSGGEVVAAMTIDFRVFGDGCLIHGSCRVEIEVRAGFCEG